ncbi:hypothetical protein PsorP6_003540 [Peronosclerospora sorghi]|uniref:Uncharacterized protein n=1 Tax=Peronosclerospora sorghi TaxID=230839 RepID=A0ACC0VKM8_9STRA|nr:hypothetical protein PsorP6_003540 [Peronosclerospora sorghi]
MMRKRKLENGESITSKKQQIKKATVTAVNVMSRLLAPDGDMGYDVSDKEWERLVQLTQQSVRFKNLFAFPENDPDWVTTKKKKRKSRFKIVAIDCEMCVTKQEGSNDCKTNALCRVSAIDGENMLQNVISDFIVHQPEYGYRLFNPKTDIHGITPEMIASSKITVAQAQKKLLKYIDQDTIVVGHSVYGDLSSLRINHRRVIDTSLIFQRKDIHPSRSTPGLKDLTKFLLGFDMPQGHDSIIDAQAAMMAAKYAVRHETGPIIPPALELHGYCDNEQPAESSMTNEYTGPPMLVTTAFRPIGGSSVAKVPANEASYIDMAATTNESTVQLCQNSKMSEARIARSCRLRVHRIPKGVSSKDIETFFLENTCIVPTAVEKIAWLPNQNRGSCNVTFSSNAHAVLAFESAQGSNGKTKITTDTIGRLQKTIAIVNCKGKTYKNVVLGIL